MAGRFRCVSMGIHVWSLPVLGLVASLERAVACAGTSGTSIASFISPVSMWKDEPGEEESERFVFLTALQPLSFTLASMLQCVGVQSQFHIAERFVRERETYLGANAKPACAPHLL